MSLTAEFVVHTVVNGIEPFPHFRRLCWNGVCLVIFRETGAAEFTGKDIGK